MQYVSYLILAISILVIYRKRVHNINQDKLNLSYDYKIQIYSQRSRKYQSQNKILMIDLIIMNLINHFIMRLSIMAYLSDFDDIIGYFFKGTLSIIDVVPLIALIFPLIQLVLRSRKQRKMKKQNKIYLEPKLLIIPFIIGFVLMNWFFCMLFTPYRYYPDGVIIPAALIQLAINIIISVIIILSEIIIKKIQNNLQENSTYGTISLKKVLNNQERIEKLSKLFSISDKVELEPTAKLIEMDRLELLDFLSNAKDLPELKIDGDYIILTSTKTLDEFVSVLDKQFTSWETTAKTKDGKINKI
jgi:hypothetical protein